MYKSFVVGFLGAAILLLIYFVTVSFVSGWDFARQQFSNYWFFVVPLSAGFGIQVGLYSYLKSMIKNMSPGVIATTGAASTAAMISCCAHYLVNVLPIVAAVGLITAISQYQVELFWLGLAFNFAGILYMLNKVIKAKKHV